jgi:hypothetical protein
VSEGVGGDPLLDPCGERSLADGALGGGFVEVVPAEFAGAGVVGEAFRGE